MVKSELENYAELIVKMGVNLQKDQVVVIQSDLENQAFAHLVQKAAYKAFASQVFIDWSDQESLKQFYLHAKDEELENFPNWQIERYQQWHQMNAVFIMLITEKPDFFAEVDSKRINRYQKIKRSCLDFHYEAIYSNRLRWCLIPVPNKSWAQKVFPCLPVEEVLDLLWDAILIGARAKGENPMKDWQVHDQSFELRLKTLNDQQFKALKFTNKLGTNLTVSLPKNHRFLGGSVKDVNGISFFPNIPTEEIFTSPHREQVEGKLIGTKPLIFDNQIIEDFVLIFEKGEIVAFSAKKGEQALETLIAYDKGTRFLGEIALVSTQSPLFQLDTVFYNTLIDENTACHIGIGEANPANLVNGEHLSVEELVEAGLNDSSILVNMTFGSPDMNVLGIKEDGTKVQLMNKGDFLF